MSAPDGNDRAGGRSRARSSESLLAHAARLRRLAAHLVADPATADDLVQDTFVAALRHAPDEDRPLGPWLGRVIRNFARRSRRDHARREERELRATGARERDLAPPDLVAERLEAQRALLDALSALDEPVRATLVLRYFEELSCADIARMQSTPAGTVRWRLKRGLDELREKLDARFGGSRATWSALFVPFAGPHLVPATPLPPIPVGQVGPVAHAAPAAAATTQGVLVMSAVSKLVGAVAVVAAAGVLWWKLDLSDASAPPLAAPSLETPKAELATKPDAPELAALATSPESIEARAPARPASEPAHAAVVEPPVAEAQRVLVVDARFLDASGTPWSGVRFVVAEDGITASTTSGPDGRARLELPNVLEHGGMRHYSFRATRAGCATVTRDLTVHDGEDGHLGDVVLLPAVTLHGRVVDRDGHGIEGAKVGLGAPELRDDDVEHAHRLGDESFSAGATTQSIEEGAFALEGVPSGKWRVWAKADGTRYGWTELLDVRGERDAFDVVVTLVPYLDTDRLMGRVVDPRGNPVPNATLLYYYETDHEAGSTGDTADAEGRFEHVVMRSTDYAIVASDPRNEWAPSAVEKVAPGSLAIEIELGERRFVEVRVRTPGERAIEGATIVASRKDPNTSSNAHTEPLGDGVYRVAMPSYAFVLDVSAPGFRSKNVPDLDASTIAKRLDVTLEPLPIVRGRVTADGKPVAGARVGLYPVIASSYEVNGFACDREHAPRGEATTDADGRYEVGCAIQGELWVWAEAKEWAAADRGPIATPRSSVDVDLELTRGGVIEGRVILPDGANAEGTIVGINHGDGRARTQRAGPEGRYRFEGLVPGKWQVLRCDKEVRPDSTWIRSTDDETSGIAWSCDVVAGRTTRFDVLSSAK